MIMSFSYIVWNQINENYLLKLNMYNKIVKYNVYMYLSFKVKARAWFSWQKRMENQFLKS